MMSRLKDTYDKQAPLNRSFLREKNFSPKVIRKEIRRRLEKNETIGYDVVFIQVAG